MSQEKPIFHFAYLLPVFLSTLVSYILLIESSVVFASHAGTAHNYFIHSNLYPEWVCVDATGSSMSSSTARARVTNTLRYDNPSSDWHALANNRIYFEFQSLSCGTLSPPQLADMKMRTYVKDNDSSFCPNNANVSCVRHYSSVHQHNGYTDYSYQIVYLKTSHINGGAPAYHHTIGHEFGHTLGLADPTNCNSTSIMHSYYYGCTDQEWPTVTDRTTVINIANSYTPPGS